MDTHRDDSYEFESDHEFHEDDTLPYSSQSNRTLNDNLIDTLNTSQTTNGVNTLNGVNGLNSMNHLNGQQPARSFISPSTGMHVDAVPTRRGRTLTIEVTDDLHSSSPWCCWGTVYRRCCFSAIGIKFSILINTIMVLLNSGMIIYEILLIIQQHTVIHTELPLWYRIADITVTGILLIEMLLSIAILHAFNLCKYLRHWECWVDMVVVTLSIGCCIMYYIDLTSESMDNLTMLFVRIIRDVFRIGRTLWFFKMLYSNLIRLELRKKTRVSFQGIHGQSLLGNNNGTVIVVNHSPKSTCSDQRDYKGPKRVDVYHEDDFHNLVHGEDAKPKNGKTLKIYSQTPSPPPSRSLSAAHSAKQSASKMKSVPERARESAELRRSLRNSQIDSDLNMNLNHQTGVDHDGRPEGEMENDDYPQYESSPFDQHTKSESQHSGRSFQRNVTRNCDELMEEFGLNDVDEEHREISGTDHTSHSATGQLSVSTGSLKSRHRSTSTKVLSLTDVAPGVLGVPDHIADQITDHIADNDHSIISTGTTGSIDIYFENLKLRKVQKKPVDTQRLKDLLNNLPSDIGHCSSDSENDNFPLKLHDSNDKLTII